MSLQVLSITSQLPPHLCGIPNKTNKYICRNSYLDKRRCLSTPYPSLSSGASAEQCQLPPIFRVSQVITIYFPVHLSCHPYAGSHKQGRMLILSGQARVLDSIIEMKPRPCAAVSDEPLQQQYLRSIADVNKYLHLTVIDTQMTVL